MIAECLVFVVGILASRMLFWRFPVLDENGEEEHSQEQRLSIIIPARNEEKRLPLLLKDLKNQSCEIPEIICVDDGSQDQTAQIAEDFGVILIKAEQKPEGWIGKSWACQKGMERATGDLFLFLDADVRIGPRGVAKLLKVYQKEACVISVMPYHQMEKRYEYFSLFFNCLQLGANGMGLAFSAGEGKKDLKNSSGTGFGLYGPVILIPREDYQAVGGHEAIKGSIVDDMALGARLREKGISFSLFLGAGDVSYRMYSEGITALIQGWTKNQAAAIKKIPLWLFVLTFLWICSCMGTPLYLTEAFFHHHWLWAGIFFIGYWTWVLELRRISYRIGSFPLSSVILYPVFLIFYLAVFFRSTIKKIFGMPVEWKERKIRLEK